MTHDPDPRFPIGRFQPQESLSPEDRSRLIERIETLPGRLRAAVSNLSRDQMDRPYREGGWTARELVHHLADSHINVFVRFKLALTEDNPAIRGYDQDAWVRLADSRTADPELSLVLMEGLHPRWAHLLRSLSTAEWGRTLQHDEWERDLSLDFLLQLYAWHGDHHLAQIVGMAG